MQHWYTDLLAAGAGAGVAAGFGAPMSGVLFAVETMLLNPTARRNAAAAQAAGAATAAPTPPTHTARMPQQNASQDEDDEGLQLASVLVACVFGAMISQAGLGDEPAFAVPKAVPFKFLEVPFCVAVGIACGATSATLAAASRSTGQAFAQLRATGIPPALMPPIGGLACGSLAMICPEITYQGFENVNALLKLTEMPMSGFSVPTIGVIVLFKIVATATCRSSGLVGGVYAPAIFIGAAVGAGFWLSTSTAAAMSGVVLSSPEMYSLVGAAAMLAAFCRVPLTAILLLFELTQDYTVILPALASVGFARWSSAAAGRYLRS